MSKNRSRLNRRLEKQTQKNLALTLLGIFLILFLLLKFGIPFLANFALFISGSKDDVTESIQGPNFISSPQLNPLPDATSSAKLTVSGKSQSSSTVDLYINGDITDKTQADKKGDFSFDITLNKGKNNIYAKARIDKKISDPSDTFSVLFKNTPPTLNINSPSDGQQFSGDQNRTSVTGTTEADTKVTVNGFWAIADQDNNFSYQLPLQNGDNEIKVIAIDPAGNKTEKIIKVKYSP